MAAPYLTYDEFVARLENAGGEGARTAAVLPEDRLTAYGAAAETSVLGRLRAFTIPPPDSDDVPALLLDIIAAFGGYTATLDYFGSQTLEDRDPVVLRYQWAREQLADIRSGVLVVDGIDVPDDGTNPDQVGGDPETYQPPVGYLGLAEGLTDTYPAWDEGRGWAHGL